MQVKSILQYFWPSFSSYLSLSNFEWPLKTGFTVQSTLFNSFLASGNFWLLITFENSLDPDQDRQKISADLDPVLDPGLSHSDSVPERIFSERSFWKKSADDNKSMKNYLACKDLTSWEHSFQLDLSKVWWSEINSSPERNFIQK